jgi:hypothetical protein
MAGPGFAALEGHTLFPSTTLGLSGLDGLGCAHGSFCPASLLTGILQPSAQLGAGVDLSQLVGARGPVVSPQAPVLPPSVQMLQHAAPGLGAGLGGGLGLSRAAHANNFAQDAAAAASMSKILQAGVLGKQPGPHHSSLLEPLDPAHGMLQASHSTLAQLESLKLALLPHTAASPAINGSGLSCPLASLSVGQGALAMPSIAHWHPPALPAVGVSGGGAERDASTPQVLGAGANGLSGLALPNGSGSHWSVKVAPGSDETTSGGSEAPERSEVSSSDGSDSGDKKCRTWKIMLTAQQAVEIYKLMPADSQHLTSRSMVVGKKFGVSAKTIRDIWKRETWVRATRPVWSEAEEQQYREEEGRNASAAANRSTSAHQARPGSVASLLADTSTHERSPSPHCNSPSAASNSGGGGRTYRSRGRPKGVKDSRPRKRRCLGGAVIDPQGAKSWGSDSSRGVSATSCSSPYTPPYPYAAAAMLGFPGAGTFCGPRFSEEESMSPRRDASFRHPALLQEGLPLGSRGQASAKRSWEVEGGAGAGSINAYIAAAHAQRRNYPHSF